MKLSSINLSFGQVLEIRVICLLMDEYYNKSTCYLSHPYPLRLFDVQEQ